MGPRRGPTASRGPAEELLEWALDTFHPRIAISAAGGVDGLALIDMAWRINPDVRVFTLDTGRLPAETYALFEEIRERYGIHIEFEVPDGRNVAKLTTTYGPNLMYRSVDLRIACCNIRTVEPLKRKLATLEELPVLAAAAGIGPPATLIVGAVASIPAETAALAAPLAQLDPR